MRNITNQQISQSVTEQYGAAFKMLENIIENCEQKLWDDDTKEPIISQIVYHTLFFVDLYLGKNKDDRENFKAKFGDDRMGEKTDGLEWNKIYSKDELLDYLTDLKQKAKTRLANLSVEELTAHSLFEWHGSTVLSSILYNLRHIMLHVGALHVRLNMVGKDPQKWVSTAII